MQLVILYYTVASVDIRPLKYYGDSQLKNICMPKKVGSILLSLYVYPELRDRFKLACTANKQNMTEVLEKFMDEYATEYEQTLKVKTEE